MLLDDRVLRLSADGLHVLSRRRAEGLAVVAAELGRARVADVTGRFRRGEPGGYAAMDERRALKVLIRV
jgi:hypothetical protein